MQGFLDLFNHLADAGCIEPFGSNASILILAQCPCALLSRSITLPSKACAGAKSGIPATALRAWARHPAAAQCPIGLRSS